MDKDFSLEYSKRSDDELLRLAADRDALTPTADVALTDELRRRKLSESDQAKHQRSVKRYRQIDSKRRRRRILGRWGNRRSWLEFLLAMLLIFVISTAYRALPSQYHFTPDWEQAAGDVMWASVFIAVLGFSQRTTSFWVSLVVSSLVHLFIVHAWIQRAGTLLIREERGAILFGVLQFFVLWFLIWALWQKFFPEDVQDDT